MKILLANEYYPPDITGGTELFLKELVDHFENKGFEFVIFTTKQEARETKNIFRVKSSPFHFGHRYQFPMLTYYWNYHNRKLINLIKEKSKDCDFFYINNIYHLSLSPFIAAKELGKNIVFDVHDYWPICLKKNLSFQNWNCSGQRNERCSRCLFKNGLFSSILNFEIKKRCELIKPDYTIVHSKFVQGKMPFKSKVIPYPYTGRIVKNRKLKYPVKIIFAGRLQKQKGVLLLPEISRQLNLLKVDHQIHILGKGKENIRGEKIINHGFLTEVRKDELFDQTDVLVVPSLWNEPFGMVCLEAMARGIPIVASDRGGLKEVVEENKVGFTVAPNPLNFAKKIAELVKNENLYKTFSKNGLRNINRYEKKKIMEQYENIFKNMV